MYKTHKISEPPTKYERNLSLPKETCTSILPENSQFKVNPRFNASQPRIHLYVLSIIS